MGLIVAQSIGSTVASAVVGVAFCWSLWHLFKQIRHPEWGPALVALLIALALTGRLPDSEFLRRALVFAAALAGPFWVAGLIWRANQRVRTRTHPRKQDRPPQAESADFAAVGRVGQPPRRYPVIVACICEDRLPSPGELKHVASRISREALFGRHSASGFAARRTALRAARAALAGS
jgi:drug/metabolite transporter superfamily protein YnfA